MHSRKWVTGEHETLTFKLALEIQELMMESKTKFFEKYCRRDIVFSSNLFKGKPDEKQF